ncbi:helix-turn-helix domain-containing protein [Eggerthella sinensis]|uniref:helix-turn-helix domain-containing protein n=1 Tax=Eggerthella sinensis TaxID=242230 RepID=UPI0022E08F05|nr:helix-turn-helix transcriptional regulator [Eggerthella sinensis]
MAIVMRLDRMMADRKISLGELAERVGIADGNLSKIKNGKVSGVRFKTLNAICRELECQVGDLFEYVDDEDGDAASDEASYAGL